jgi:hypothetical protein
VNEYILLNEYERIEYIWKRSCESLKLVAKKAKNQELAFAIECAYKRGVDLHLNPDYKVFESSVELYGTRMMAAIWYNFSEESISSKLVIEKNDKVVFEKHLDSTKNGTEFFLEIYKGIHADGNTITIEGRKDVHDFPIKILIPYIDS